MEQDVSATGLRIPERDLQRAEQQQSRDKRRRVDGDPSGPATREFLVPVPREWMTTVMANGADETAVGGVNGGSTM